MAAWSAITSRAASGRSRLNPSSPVSRLNATYAWPAANRGAGAEFDPRVAERPALAFVDGDRPRGFERELPVGADGPGFQAGGGPSILAFFLVVVLVPVLSVLVGFDEDGSVDLPFVGAGLDDRGRIPLPWRVEADDRHGTGRIHVQERAHAAVRPQAAPVVAEHHDPHAGLHPQFRRRGFEPLAPFAGTLRAEQHRPAWQPVEHHPVDPVGPPVRGAEDDVASRVARPPHRPVQERQGSGRRAAVPQIVQRGLEQGIRLAVHALEHHPVQQPLVHDRADGLGLEEPGPLPLAAGPEHPGLGAAHVYDGRQLGEVAGEDHLHAAEREPRFAGAFEEPVEAVHEVGARHAHLVQHDRVQRPVEPVAGQFAPLGRGLRGGDGRAGVHEPVHGDALHVQGGYPRGGRA